MRDACSEVVMRKAGENVSKFLLYFFALKKPKLSCRQEAYATDSKWFRLFSIRQPTIVGFMDMVVCVAFWGVYSHSIIIEGRLTKYFVHASLK